MEIELVKLVRKKHQCSKIFDRVGRFRNASFYFS